MSRSHHHQQQSMNEYEATFMNILMTVIFLFQLSFSLFFSPFPALSDLPLALPRSIFLCLCLSLLLCRRILGPLPWVTSTPRSYLNVPETSGVSHKASKRQGLYHRVPPSKTVGKSFSSSFLSVFLFSFFISTIADMLAIL